MTSQPQSSVDLSVLIDVISNMAGMMILLACVAVVLREQTSTGSVARHSATKSISFPLAYVPNKRSLTLAIKDQRLYELPERELVEAVAEKTRRGQTVDWLRLHKNGVDAIIALTPTITGFRFQYKLLPGGGVPLNSSDEIVAKLDQLVRQFPPDRFFFTIHSWPESMRTFREIREYLLESGVEVGWTPRSNDPDGFDIVYSMGEYSEDLTTIRAQ